MNTAIFRRALADGFWQLVFSVLIVFGFAWLFVWLMGSLVQLGLWTSLLNLLPKFIHKAMGMSPAALVSTKGRLSILFVHAVPMLIFVGWAVGRGSDTIAGNLERGILELLATLPCRRFQFVVVPSLATLVGIVILSIALWTGLAVGLYTVPLDPPVDWREFWPAVLNLASMSFALVGISTFVSAIVRNRWRCIWITLGLFTISIIIKLVARLWDAGQFLAYLSFLSAFEPQILILEPETTAMTWRYCSILVAIGTMGIITASLMLAHRDVPGPD
ncbi:hypothetical protein JCM19992_25720 [Thermostilla marina]